jgi:HAE1 family hydrophobic/amphiphilic exporter-1
MWLTRVAINRPVAISMLFVALAVMGWRSMRSMPVDLYPPIDIPYVSITTIYPGAGPEEVENSVTQPLEESVSGINNLKNVQSTSQEGVSTISLEFHVGTDVDAASQDVRSRVDAVMGQLPDDAERPVVAKLDITAIPIMSIGLSSPRPPAELRKLADDVIKDRLARVRGVGAVGVAGGDVREILVAVDKSRLEAQGVSIMQVSQALKAENLNVPTGTVENTRREFAVRAMGEFSSVRDIDNVKIPTANGPVRLTDIATVRDTVADRKVLTRLDRNDSVALTVLKQSGANTVAVAEGVKAELERLSGRHYLDESREGEPIPGVRPLLPADVSFRTAFDQSDFILDVLNELRSSLLLGALLASIVVFLFLHTLRGTAIVALAIPTSLISTFIPIYFSGFTMNMMVMMAMALSVGILVDDSIVVLENIYRHLALGEPPREAAFNGRTEIGLAAMTITMVDVVVFVPIAFMGGIVGMFFRQFGITVACATLFSLFVSFALTPMLASRWAKREDILLERAEVPVSGVAELARVAGGSPSRSDFLRRVFRQLDIAYNALDHLYRQVLAWSLQHRVAVLLIGPIALIGVMTPITKGIGLLISAGLIALGMLAGAVFCRGSGRRAVLILGAAAIALAVSVRAQLGFEFFPSVDQGQFRVSVEMPAGTSLKQTDHVARQLEETLFNRKVFPEVKTVFTSAGSTSQGLVGEQGRGALYADLSVVLVDKKQRRRSDKQVMEVINRYADRIPGADVKVAAGGMGGHSESPLTIELSGNDVRELTTVAQRLRDCVAAIPGVVDADISWKSGRPECQVKVDRDRLAEKGLTTAQVAGALRTALEGGTETKFRQGGDEFDIRVRLRERDRARLADIDDLVVGSTPAGTVRLKDIATCSMAAGPTKIDRKNRVRMVQVTAGLAPGYYLGNVRQVIDRAIADFDYGGTKMAWGGEVEMQQESFGLLISALGLSIVLVFILMAALFESILSPFIIMLSLPMALVGGIAALIVTGKTLSIITMIGIIMLVGLVTKNAILLVDYTNTLRARGKERNEAILEAGPTRLRPILMTTLTMIFGMLPTALALGKGAEMRSPMAITVIGGLILSTLLTLVFIPVLYTYMDDLSRRLGFAGVRQRTEAM